MSSNMGIKCQFKNIFKVFLFLGILNFAYIFMQLFYSKDFGKIKLQHKNEIHNIEQKFDIQKDHDIFFSKQFTSKFSNLYTTKNYIKNQNFHISSKQFDLQKKVDYISKYLDIKVMPCPNFGGVFSFNIELVNTGDEPILGCCWSIYFYSTKYLKEAKILKGITGLNIQLTHVVGYTYKLTFLTMNVLILPNVLIILKIKGRGWIVNKSDFIPNWYVACDTCQDTISKLILSTMDHESDNNYSNNDTFSSLGVPFIHDFPEFNMRYSSDHFIPLTPYLRFKNNEIRKEEVAPYVITPRPFIISNYLSSAKEKLNKIEFKEFTFSKWKIASLAEFEFQAEYLKKMLGIKYPIRYNLKQHSSNVIFLIKSAEVARVMELNLKNIYNDTFHDQSSAYRLLIAKDFIVLKATQDVGIFYGIMSLLQLIQNDKFIPQPSPQKKENEESEGEVNLQNKEESGTCRLPKIEILDAARFKHRGLMVDVSRNFQDIKSLKKTVEVMALYKMNVLHLHLADDEAWRLEIPALPELTQVGACRGHNLKEEKCLMSMLGYKPANNYSDRVTQFYSVEDFQDLLDHASAHHVKIIPEFDMPSHSHAALVAMRARFKSYKSKGMNKKAVEFLLHDLGDNSRYMTGQFYTFSAINPCIQSTYNFVTKLFQEVIKIYKNHNSLTHIHLGGDEVSEHAFSDSPVCEGLKKRLGRKRGGIANAHDLKVFFVKSVANIAKQFNLSIIGWQDAFNNNEGSFTGFDKDKTEVVSQYYYNVWESGYGNIPHLLANKGMKVIMSPATNLYLDNPQEPNSDEPGLHWAARYVDTKRIFSFTPHNIFNSIKNDFSGNKLTKATLCSKLKCLSLKKPENVIGMEAALWSELVRTRSRMEMMLFPRLLAVAERSWHRGVWEGFENQTVASMKMNDDWREFAGRVGTYELRRLEEYKVKYYVPKPGAFIQDGILRVNTMFPGLRVKMKKGKVTAEEKWVEVFDGQSVDGLDLSMGITLVTESYDGKRKSLPVYLKTNPPETPRAEIVSL